MRGLFKFFLLVVVVVTLMIHHFILNLLLRKGPRKLRILSKSVGRYCRLSNKILGLKINSDLKPEQSQGLLIISNHMSYLDILVLSSVYPTLYVTSVEMKETLFLGQVCSLCACLFTERRKGKRTAMTMKKDIGDIGELLSLGFSTTIFPEGTSTNGMGLLPFKTTLLESAIATQKKILPIAIGYTHIDGKAFDNTNNDIVCWHGDTNFFIHLLGLVKAHEVRVKIKIAHAISPLELKDRYNLGKISEKMISELYQQMKWENL
ncbi:MAG: lysophospholipid acyltransferase family protein [Bacteriovoracaceae bacterium]